MFSHPSPLIKDIMNIVIGMPVLDKVEALTMFNVIDLLFYSQRRQLHFAPAIGCTIIHDARNHIISEAYNTDFDGIFFVDADMTFPGDILEKMIKNDKDICGVLYLNHASGTQNVFTYDKNIDEFLKIRLEPNKGLVKVDAVGSGLFYVKRKVLDAIGSPWFFYEAGIGEDVNFCKVARSKGFEIYVDTDINVGHIGKEIRRVVT